MNGKIGFSALRKSMSRIIRHWDDHRDPKKIDIALHDVVMSGFACMVYQEPSLLQFQKNLEDSVHENNLRTQFDIQNIPSTTQMKEVTDYVDSDNFADIFNMYHKKLTKAEVIDTFKNKLGTYYISADGTQYFTSTKIHCDKCLTKECKDGIHYSHQMLQGAIVLPGKKVVIPLMPVEISNEPTINPTKQDCEWKGFLRFLSVLKRGYLQLPFTFTLDALYADQVIVDAIRKQEQNFIIVSKPDDNKYLHEEFTLVTTKRQALEYDDGEYLHVYTWANNLPINSKRKVFVNFVNYEMRKLVRPGEYKVSYKNTWITSHDITEKNVSEIALGGRVKWKVENECFNTTKNQGYCLEHSYGHGENNLSFNFAVLTMLAFFMHQILECTDELYQACRKKLGSKMNLWSHLRTYIKCYIFSAFEVLLDFTLNKRKYIGDGITPQQHREKIIRDGPIFA